jgi:hypothetical protein
MNDFSPILKAVIKGLHDSGVIQDPENLTKKDWDTIEEGCDHVINVYKHCNKNETNQSS